MTWADTAANVATIRRSLTTLIESVRKHPLERSDEVLVAATLREILRAMPADSYAGLLAVLIVDVARGRR